MIFEQIQNDIKDAMRAKDTLKLSTLRSILAAMKNELVSGVKKDTLTDEESLKILKKLGKQRKDSIEQFTSGNRPDLAEKEMQEYSIIEAYLPAEMSDEELIKIIEETMKTEGLDKKSDMGRLMGLLIKKTSGQADGSRIKSYLEQHLN
ncbi:MAG: GatB/YqeY domain-containing protein [Candidatus Gracilibacteria bacterium]